MFVFGQKLYHQEPMARNAEWFKFEFTWIKAPKARNVIAWANGPGNTASKVDKR